MNDTLIVTVYMVIDDLMRALGHRSHPRRAAIGCCRGHP